MQYSDLLREKAQALLALHDKLHQLRLALQPHGFIIGAQAHNEALPVNDQVRTDIVREHDLEVEINRSIRVYGCLQVDGGAWYNRYVEEHRADGDIRAIWAHLCDDLLNAIDRADRNKRAQQNRILLDDLPLATNLHMVETVARKTTQHIEYVPARRSVFVQGGVIPAHFAFVEGPWALPARPRVDDRPIPLAALFRPAVIARQQANQRRLTAWERAVEVDRHR